MKCPCVRTTIWLKSYVNSSIQSILMTCPVLVVSPCVIVFPRVNPPCLSPAVFVVRFNAAAAPPDTLADDLSFRISGPESYVGVR